MSMITKASIQQEWKELLFLITLQQARESQAKFRELTDKFVKLSIPIKNGSYHIPYLFELTPSNWRDLNVTCYYPVDDYSSEPLGFSLYLKMMSKIKRYQKRKAYSYLGSCIDIIINGLIHTQQFIKIYYHFPSVIINLPLLINPEYPSEIRSNGKFTISSVEMCIDFPGIKYCFNFSELIDTQFAYVLNSLYWQCTLIKKCQRQLKQQSEFVISIGD